MQIEWFISKRIAFSSRSSFSKFIVRISIAAVALSIAIMLMATSLVNGFQKEVKRKVYGFWGHIHISEFGYGNSFEERPISRNQDFLDSLYILPGVKNVQVYANKAGILKSHGQIEGIVLKGVSTNFDWTYFNSCIDTGRVLDITNTKPSKEILLSRYTSKLLGLTVGDKVTLHFLEKTPRVRVLDIVGIYNTGLGEYDKFYALIDIKQIVKLNGWAEDQVGGFEVFLDTDKGMTEMAELIDAEIIPPEMIAYSISELYPNIFDWLGLLDIHEVIIISLMIIVAIINMITCLIILILERTNMVGILKALGAQTASIQRIFLLNGAYILGVGILIGNGLAIGLMVLQQQYGLITLPEESYYVSQAQVDIDFMNIFLINLGAFVISVVVLFIPSLYVGRISPIKAIRFD